MTFSITRVQTERGFLYAPERVRARLSDFVLDSKYVVLHN